MSLSAFWFCLIFTAQNDLVIVTSEKKTLQNIPYALWRNIYWVRDRFAGWFYSLCLDVFVNLWYFVALDCTNRTDLNLVYEEGSRNIGHL
jgi:hypothetical protein